MLNAINNQAYFLISYFCKVNHFKEKFYLYLGNDFYINLGDFLLNLVTL